MRHLSEAQLNDYVDGVLDPEAYAATDEHVRDCGVCAGEVAALRRLLTAASTLPLSLEPPAHLWSAVRRETIDERLNRRHLLWELRAPLAAAALLLVVATSGVTWWVTRDGEAPVVAQLAAGPLPQEGVTLGLARAEADYLEAARTLLLVIEERRNSMDPAVVQTVEENVRVMDGAISSARAALQADPQNQDIAAILSATYQQKVQMLKRAVQLSGET